MTPGLIERYRDRLPVSAATPVVTLGEGGTPLLPAPRISERTGVRRLPQVRGREPDRVVQGPGDDGGRVQGARGRRPRGRLRLDRQHLGVGGRLLRPRRPPPGGRAAGGRDRARQAGPGPDLRRARDRGPGRASTTRWGSSASWSTRRAGRPPELDQPVPAGGPEDGRVRGARAARRRARLGGAARSATAATSPPTGWASTRWAWRRGCWPARRRVPRRCVHAARRWPTPSTIATAIRIGNPARLDQALARGRRVRAAACARSTTAASWPPTGCSRRSEGVFCEPASAASVAALLEARRRRPGRAAARRSSACSPATGSRIPTRPAPRAPRSCAARRRSTGSRRSRFALAEPVACLTG